MADEIKTTYFRWEGEACRLHERPDGTQTADLYRAGKGLVPINPGELYWSVEIGIVEYEELKQEEDDLYARAQAAK